MQNTIRELNLGASGLDPVVQEQVAEFAHNLKGKLSPRRYQHSIGVLHTAIRLAEHHGADTASAAIAAILHDCAKDYNRAHTLRLCEQYGIELDEISAKQPEMLHAKLGAAIAEDQYGIDEPDILSAIRNHTTGSPYMGLLDKIIYISDYIEPERSHEGVEAMRKVAFENLDLAVLMGTEDTIRHLMDKGRLLHPDTVNTRNWLISKLA